ncbi:MAG: HepT-like ribonuclease domain-containing protein [Candidatus Bathyarchaeia archaeon]
MVDRDFVNGKARDVRNVISELTRLASKRFEDMSVDEQYSMRYQVIVLAESIVSLCSHIALEAYGYEPSLYKDCVAYICRREGVGCVEDVEALVGMRNLLLHRYWNIDDQFIHSLVKSNFKCVHQLLGRIVSKYG